MSSFFDLELDTTPPLLQLTSEIIEDTISIKLASNESLSDVQCTIYDTRNNQYSTVLEYIDNNWLGTYDLKNLINPLAEIRVNVLDDVWNSASIEKSYIKKTRSSGYTFRELPDRYTFNQIPQRYQWKELG